MGFPSITTNFSFSRSIDMKLLITILSLSSVIMATPVPANVYFRASVSTTLYDTNTVTPTFSTILPTYTPTQPTLKPVEDVKILFNNQDEISKAEDEAKSTTIYLPVAQSSSDSAQVPEYKF